MPMSDAAILHLDPDTPKAALLRPPQSRFRRLRCKKNIFLPSIPVNTFFMQNISGFESITCQPPASVHPAKSPAPCQNPLQNTPQNTPPLLPPFAVPSHTRSTLATNLA